MIWDYLLGFGGLLAFSYLSESEKLRKLRKFVQGSVVEECQNVRIKSIYFEILKTEKNVFLNKLIGRFSIKKNYIAT